MMGLIAVKTEEMYRSIKLSAVALGCPAGPDDAYLALRSLKPQTLDPLPSTLNPP